MEASSSGGSGPGLKERPVGDVATDEAYQSGAPSVGPKRFVIRKPGYGPVKKWVYLKDHSAMRLVWAGSLGEAKWFGNVEGPKHLLKWARTQFPKDESLLEAEIIPVDEAATPVA